MEDGPPIFRQDFTCPALLVVHLVLPRCFRLQGYHLLWRHFPEPSTNNEDKEYRLIPFRSPLLWESRLISARRATEMFQFTHCPPSLPMCSAGGRQTSLWRGCPIRILKAHRLYAAPPERFAGLRVLHRHSAPRHPPRTLCSLFSFFSYFFGVRSSASTLARNRSAKLKIHPIQLFMCRC